MVSHDESPHGYRREKKNNNISVKIEMSCFGRMSLGLVGEFLDGNAALLFLLIPSGTADTKVKLIDDRKGKSGRETRGNGGSQM